MNAPFILLLAGALAMTTATTASAYQFSNPNASIRLHGKITFLPSGGQPFTCDATLYLKTRTKPKKQNEIRSIRFSDGFCHDVQPQFLPWIVTIHNIDTAEFTSGGSFNSTMGSCTQDIGVFNVDKTGLWTVGSGQCISGKLKSRPSTIITP